MELFRSLEGNTRFPLVLPNEVKGRCSDGHGENDAEPVDEIVERIDARGFDRHRGGKLTIELSGRRSWLHVDDSPQRLGKKPCSLMGLCAVSWENCDFLR